jgi:hypothetical protein
LVVRLASGSAARAGSASCAGLMPLAMRLRPFHTDSRWIPC